METTSPRGDTAGSDAPGPAHRVSDIAVAWWHGGSDYRERVDYFTSRSLVWAFRTVISVCAVLFCVVATALLLLSDQPHNDAAPPVVSTAILIAAAAAALFWAVRWLVGPVPTERTAVVFSLSSTALIVAVSWTDAEVMAGVAGLNTTVLVGCFTAFVLSPRHLVAHSVLCLAAIALFVPQMVADYDWALACVKSLMLIAVTVGLPACVQVGMAVLSIDAAASDTDPLTGVFNRRGFRNATRRSIVRHTAGRDHAPVALMVVDVDDFKTINDELGHDAGDAVLAGVAGVLREIAAGAVVARIGGDEFAVAATGGTADEHVAMAHRLHRAIEAVPLPGAAAVTASVGVAIGTVPVQDPHAVDAMLAEADDAMYRAKRTRRSVVVSAQPLLAGRED